MTQVAFDSLTHGFSAVAPGDPWFHIHMGTYTSNDGISTALPGGGLHVAPRGANPRTGAPAFTSSVAPEGTPGGVPATNDHAKWLAYMNRTSSAGFPGFDACGGLELVGTAHITGRTYGTEHHPFGTAAADPHDVRLAAFAMATIDLETFMVFDFLFTNRHVYALYERLPFGRAAEYPYAAFTYAIPVKHRTVRDMHEAAISYDRAAGAVRWILDGSEVYRVTAIGHRLTSRTHLLIDLGGDEQTVTPRQLAFGMGLFTLLDGAGISGPGLVRLSDTLQYYSPRTGPPHLLAFVDESSRTPSRLFGQGAEMQVQRYIVAYAGRADEYFDRPST